VEDGNKPLAAKFAVGGALVGEAKLLNGVLPVPKLLLNVDAAGVVAVEADGFEKELKGLVAFGAPNAFGVVVLVDEEKPPKDVAGAVDDVGAPPKPNAGGAVVEDVLDPKVPNDGAAVELLPEAAAGMDAKEPNEGVAGGAVVVFDIPKPNDDGAAVPNDEPPVLLPPNENPLVPAGAAGVEVEVKLNDMITL
jgi:hypothetical protein